MSQSTATTTLRRATKADLPHMVRMLLDAFGPGPWGRTLFPPHLKVKLGDGDEFDWRLYVITMGFESPGRDTVLACKGGGAGNAAEEIVGWAQWIDMAAAARGGMSPEVARARMDRDLGPDPAGLDRAAFDTLSREGQGLEESFEEFLGPERSKASWRTASTPSMNSSGKLIRCIATRAELPDYRAGAPVQRNRQALAKDGLERAASQGVDVCLRAMPEGRPLYRALGFEQVREKETFGKSQYAMVWTASA